MHGSGALSSPSLPSYATSAGLLCRPVHGKSAASGRDPITSDGNLIAPSNNFDPTRMRPWIEPTEPSNVIVPKLDGWAPLDSISSKLFTKDIAREVGDPVTRLLQSALPHYRPAHITASAPIGIWEGEVLEVDLANKRFSAKLAPLRGADSEMSGDISFNQINPEDRALLIPGSVFYIEQYSRYVKKQISYDQRVRFRRLPRWTEEMIASVSSAAKELEGIDSERTATY